MKWPVVALLVALPQAALAHAMLEHATPGAGATLKQSPAHVQLEFSEPLEPSFSGATVTDARGNSVVSGAPQISESSMTVNLKPLTPGEYRVQWHAVSVDTHRTEGGYSFQIGP
jgi:hypothetical protein